MEKDPAATSKRMVFWNYPGFKALMCHRIAHALYRKGLKGPARFVARIARRTTAIEIHPAAIIGRGVFIDHGAGLVIGETAIIGDNVTLYQGVTLGGTGKQTGKRHPTLEDDVMVSAGAKVLGPVVIGKGSKVGAGSVVLKDVPPHSTVVGVPGRIVRQNGKKVDDMDQVKLPDPILEEFKRLNDRIAALEDKLGVKSCRYSLSADEYNVSKSDDGDKNQR